MPPDAVLRTLGLALAIGIGIAGNQHPAAAQTLWHIYVMNADGSDVKKVSRATERLLGGPCWSHDGKTLYYCGAPRNDQWNRSRIFKQRLDGDTVENLGPGVVPHPSPDDQQIVFHVRPGNPAGETPGIYVMNADGSGREWLCAGHHPRWSPDGARIALVSDHEGFPGIYLFDTVTLEKTRVLARGYGNVIGASWSNDGEQLVFIGHRADQGEVSVVRAAPDQPPTVVYQGNAGWQSGRRSTCGSCSLFALTIRSDCTSSTLPATSCQCSYPTSLRTETATPCFHPTGNRSPLAAAAVVDSYSKTPPGCFHGAR